MEHSQSRESASGRSRIWSRSPATISGEGRGAALPLLHLLRLLLQKVPDLFQEQLLRRRGRGSRQLGREPAEGKNDQEVDAGGLEQEGDHGVDEVADAD